MRLTRYMIGVLFVLGLGGAALTAIAYFGGITLDSSSAVLQYVGVALLLLPIVFALVGAMTVYANRHTFHYSRLPQEHATPERIDEVPQQDDPTIHLGLGLMMSVLNDFSLGRLVNPDVYTPQMRAALEQEIQFFQVYRDRGYIFHFQFHHEETYEAFVRFRLNRTEAVVEVAGVFDYYFERNGEQHPTPHGYDQNPPLIRVPAVMRLRVLHNEQSGQWQLSGFSESIRGLQLGLATQ